MEEALAEIFRTSETMVLTVAGVFMRVGAAAFLVPGLGERGVPMRLRLGAAVALTLVLSPIIWPLVPGTPQDPTGLVLLLLAEAAAGLVIGLAFRALVFILQLAGATAAAHLSLNHIFGSGVAPEPEPTLATLLGLGGIVIAMNAGLHLALVAALAGLYEVMPFGQFPSGAALGDWSAREVAQIFALGISLALPFVAISFAYNIALGALSRAMPQLLVVLVGVPVLIGLGMLTLWLALPQIYEHWGAEMAERFGDPLGRRR